jgi:lipopolysaccharide/colanic/teichoic acid biosynthesis glycosyltransferase
MRRTLYLRIGKRGLDLIIAVALLVIWVPAVLVLAAVVRWKLGAPVIFRQQRSGRDGQPFWMYKFRTMTNATDVAGNLLPDEERLTPFGRFLRSTSLDELPELWNVIRGEMSLVGPRPLLVEYLPLYTPEQARRHDVLPGVTGWAQVNGRNTLTWKKKFACDVWYVDHVSLWLDLAILAMTVLRVLRRDGISAAGCATMPPFTRSNADIASRGAADEPASKVA